MWTIKEGMRVVRGLQPHTRQFGYHLTLGGGVLNNGESKKDLDLYFLPLDNREVTPDANGMRKFLNDHWKEERNLDGSANYGSTSFFTYKLEFRTPDNKRVDVFIA